MIICPLCSSASSVVETRAHANTVRRRRRCDAPHCQHRWTTYEVSSTFLDLAAELPSLLSQFNASAATLAQAIDDYDLHAFGETDATGKHVAARQPPRCPNCLSSNVRMTDERDGRRPARYRCLDCNAEGTGRTFTLKRR